MAEEKTSRTDSPETAREVARAWGELLRTWTATGTVPGPKQLRILDETVKLHEEADQPNCAAAVRELRARLEGELF